jgi:methionyl-tRNA formyltransferase
MQFLPAGSLSRIVLIGAGQLTPTAVQFAVANGIEVFVFTGPRQRELELLEGGLLGDELARLGVEMRVVEDLRACESGPFDLAGDGALAFSIGSPFIIRQDLIDLYGGRILNSHGAPLPEWRGGGGFSWRILAGERRGRTCFHLVTPAIDAGDIVFMRDYEFPAETRYPRDYMAYAVDDARRGLQEMLEGILAGCQFELSSQDEAASTYFPRLDTNSHGWIDWSWPGAMIERFVLAFSHPYSGARTTLQNREIRIFDCRFQTDPRHEHRFFDGLVFRCHEKRCFVACRDGTLSFDVSDVLTERPIRVGDRLFTPQQKLEAAMQTRATFTPSGLLEA